MNDLMLHRAAQLLEAEFGPQWRTVADMLGTEGLRKRVGKELTSFMAYPERGEGGNSQWHGKRFMRMGNGVNRIWICMGNY